MAEGRDTIILEQKRKGSRTGFLGSRGLLIILSSNYFGKTCQLRKRETVIGRQVGCDLTLGDPLVSRQHCRISRTAEGDFFLEDLDSSNATFVNNKALRKPVQLFFGDRIVMGNTILRFFLEESLEHQ